MRTKSTIKKHLKVLLCLAEAIYAMFYTRELVPAVHISDVCDLYM